MNTARRVLTVGHSYCVRRNRELAEALAAAGGASWDVTVLAPTEFPGDLGLIRTSVHPDERCEVRTVPMRRAPLVQLMRYGGELQPVLLEGWDLVHCWEEPYVVASGQVARAC